MPVKIGPGNRRVAPTGAQVSLWGHLQRLLVDDVYELRSDVIAQEVLHGTADAAKNADPTDPRVFTAFADLSVDVVMRGGTASGVVYPAAVCAIAEKFRLRNVGGSSAGAIAAAAAAAAELGRRRMLVPRDSVQDRPAESFESGRFRRGFAGLADLTAWLTEMTEDGPPVTGPERYRLASLFQPVADARPLFRVAKAVMQGNYPLLLVLLPIAAGWTVAIASVASVVLGIVATTVATSGQVYGWATVVSAAAMLAVTLLAAGAVIVMIAVTTHHDEKRLSRTGAVLLVGGAGLLVVAVAAGPPDAAARVVLGLSAVGAVAFALVVNVTGYVVAFGSRLITKAQKARYGLISGGDTGRRTEQVTPLVPWLSDMFSQLAGQPGRVLRFGDLWLDEQFRPAAGVEGGDEVRALCEAAAVDATLRQVNLELMASDISHGVAYRFPLHHVARHHSLGVVGFQEQQLPHADLYVCPADFTRTGAGVFPPDVLDALCDTTSAETATCSGPDGDESLTVHRLPDPWNLPVVFAVRLSMSLPFVFQAVPLYRQLPDTGDGLRVMRVWFSDGGLTSNFPIHFFDEMLPPWPTLGVNLTGTVGPPDPEGDLPPADGSPARARIIGTSVLDFFSAIFATSRNWRDNMHILLPGFGMRVFNVQLGPGEGDTNIFMKRDVMAALAMRGVRAGTRLSTTFHRSRRPGSAWRQHQSIRLQTMTMSIARTLKLWNDDAPEVGLLAAVVEGPENGTRDLVSEPGTLLDGVFPADVVAVWDTLHAATADLWPRSAPRDPLARLVATTGEVAADARALAAVVGGHRAHPPERLADFVAATSALAAAAWTVGQTDVAAAARELEQELARLLPAVAGPMPATDGADAWQAWDELSAALVDSATRLDVAAGPLAMANPAASAWRLSQTWDRHGVMESRPSPRS